ncbi:FG-GAP repeat domain-containing protein [Streptomyces longispororuber]|uniref:FG-GAP repeat domain-containing protein n=1 Tax=Streptomyces longispororuber TaxID=68230 RepID=UPI00210D50D9|nr:VCBS repeat-containing protein [Streptomyces longispororuber]MCQ4208926.1 VCBS repeat-containing protein [Streptomyces longispororuber]
MTWRTAPPAALVAVCGVLALLAGCGSGTPGERDDGASRSGSPTPLAAPTASRAPAPGKGSRDPDDLNGDGHRDLLLPLDTPGGEPQWEPADGRILVVYGSSGGLDPVTRAVYGRSDLGLPAAVSTSGVERPEDIDARRVATADLDGDGFADLVVPHTGRERATDGNVTAQRSTLYVAWGSPHGPGAPGRKATPVQLPQRASVLGLKQVVRGDFDGDGHHDLAGVGDTGSDVWFLYGPFDRSTGAPARTGTLPGNGGSLYADPGAVDTPGDEPRTTPLLQHATDDGEQSGNTLYTDPATGRGRELRAGNARAFGDFDGDGRRDVAVGDDGSRNDEPGSESEPPEVDGSLTVYPGDGGPPVRRELPRSALPRRGFSTPLVYVAADPDGDGRDGILLPTYDGVSLLEDLDGTGGSATMVREGPARAHGKKLSAQRRHARPYTAADFDGNGRDEPVLNWSADPMYGYYGDAPTHWWVTDGVTARDRTAFDASAWVEPRVWASPSG